MSKIASYLTFDGNCREAMSFYQECFGGQLSFQTVGEIALKTEMPAKMKDSILHSILVNENFVLMGSDMTPQSGLIKGNNISLMLQCRNEKEIRKIYSKLSEGCISQTKISQTYWGSLNGSLTDKFGNHWILNFNNTNH